MKRYRILGLCIAAVLAGGALSASAASAASPTWHLAGKELAAGTKLKFNINGGTARLYQPSLSVVIVCKKTTGSGELENIAKQGSGTSKSRYEECAVWSTKANASGQIAQNKEVTACGVRDSLEKKAGTIAFHTAKSFLAYVPGREPGNKSSLGAHELPPEIVDVLEPESEHYTGFVTIEITGAECGEKSTFNLEGGLIGKIPRAEYLATAELAGSGNEEAVMGNVLFEANDPLEGKAVTQRNQKYELSKVVTRRVLTVATDELTFEGTEQVELAPNAAAPLGPEPFGAHV